MVMVNIELPNGIKISAQSEAWLLAILAELPADLQAKVFKRVSEQQVLVSKPGQYILHAEPGIIGG